MLHSNNCLLESLPVDVLARLSPQFETIAFSSGEVLVRNPVDYVYFPMSGLISFTISSNHHKGMEIAMTGREGCIGTSAFFNMKRPFMTGVARFPGKAIRLPAGPALEEFQLGDQFQQRVMHYFRSFFMQVARISLCNAQHPLEKRFCRWLLMTRDRLDEHHQISMTQEMISNMLGVRREAISRVAQSLKSRGLIDYGTRRLEIVDREGLLNMSCECYALMQGEYQATFRQPPLFFDQRRA